MMRQPAVAHQFYPGDRDSLIHSLQGLVPHLQPDQQKKGIAVISPHAGYIYSGAIAGETLAATQIPETVIIMGPNHHGRGSSVALMAEGQWQMPMGIVSIDDATSNAILTHCPLVKADSQAHRFEHSLEVQVPFLQYLQPDIKIVPLTLSYISLEECLQLGTCLTKVIKESDRDILLLASSDMTHYESRQAATQKDRMAIDRIIALDPVGLYETVISNKISMCGIIPATISLAAAVDLGAEQATLIRYTDSGDASGDTTQVVGYAGIIIA